MTYNYARLQFGTDKRVPGAEMDLSLANDQVPVQNYLVDPDKNLWDLVFTFKAPSAFYQVGSMVNNPEDAMVKSWYFKEIDGPPGGNALILYPFSGGQFLQTDSFVDFSEPSPSPNSIDTDKIMGATATATAHLSLPEFGKITVSTHATSHSIITTTEVTSMTFEKFFVLFGNATIVGNTLTVPKGQSCQALAVYKKETSKSSHEFRTDKWPKIPKWEWPQVIAEVVQAIAIKGNGEIWEYLSPNLLAEVEPEALRMAVEEISGRITALDNVKAMIGSLVERR
jgi:hypothetical protein